MIIGLTGYKGSGKDTVAAYLIKEYGFERRAFADPLKRSFAALFDIPPDKIDELKNDPAATIYLNVGDTYAPEELLGKGMTCRYALQRYGTEAHRDVFGEDFWINQTLPVGGYYTGRKIVVTDCRFENEVERVQKLGGYILRIDRDMDIELDIHSSENIEALQYNERVANNGTLHELFVNVDAALERLAILETDY